MQLRPSRTISLVTVSLLLTAVTACREPDRPLTLPPAAGLIVDSDPRGGRILIDGRGTGRITPDTLLEVESGAREVRVLLDTANLTYVYRTLVNVEAVDTLVRVHGPLLVGCASRTCVRDMGRYRTAAGIRFSANALGPLFFLEGQGEGMFWPVGTSNSYASVGMPVFAGLAGQARDTVALGPYDVDYLVGRPAPVAQEAGGTFELRQKSWILPPPAVQLTRPTIRGIEIDTRLLGRSDADGILLLRLTFRNITDRYVYQLTDPVLPEKGITYRDAYIGFALDGDVGTSDDDLLTYVPHLDMAIIYDANFSQPGFSGGWSTRPALLGLRVLDAPPGSTVILNGWPRDWDWRASMSAADERAGWRWLSGNQNWPQLEYHPDPRLGFVTGDPQDVRISVSAGPLELAPGDSASLTLAVLLAPPAEGTYSPGVVVPPGDPFDGGRQILQVASPLLEKAVAAEALLLELVE